MWTMRDWLWLAAFVVAGATFGWCVAYLVKTVGS